MTMEQLQIKRLRMIARVESVVLPNVIQLEESPIERRFRLWREEKAADVGARCDGGPLGAIVNGVEITALR